MLKKIRKNQELERRKKLISTQETYHLTKLKRLLKLCRIKVCPKTSLELLSKCLEHGINTYQDLILIIISLSLGCTVDGVSPKVITERINNGEIEL